MRRNRVMRQTEKPLVQQAQIKPSPREKWRGWHWHWFEPIVRTTGRDTQNGSLLWSSFIGLEGTKRPAAVEYSSLITHYDVRMKYESRGSGVLDTRTVDTPYVTPRPVRSKKTGIAVRVSHADRWQAYRSKPFNSPGVEWDLPTVRLIVAPRRRDCHARGVTQPASERGTRQGRV